MFLRLPIDGILRQEESSLSLLQRIGSILCIFALLFSNVAGFVHLGCSQASSDIPHTHQQFAGASDDHHHHCGHSHSHAASEETSHTSPSEQSCPHDSDPSDHHDRDTCNLCQSLYTNEDGVTVVDSPAPIIELAQAELTHLFNEIFCDQILLSLKLVRGPPQV